MTLSTLASALLASQTPASCFISRSYSTRTSGNALTEALTLTQLGLYHYNSTPVATTLRMLINPTHYLDIYVVRTSNNALEFNIHAANCVIIIYHYIVKLCKRSLRLLTNVQLTVTYNQSVYTIPCTHYSFVAQLAKAAVNH